VSEVTKDKCMTEEADNIRFTVRVNESLHRQIANAAKNSERSLNSEIIYRLKRSFEREPFEAAA